MKYKGNLHVHTTRSDGKKTPAECIDLYKKNGYDFIAITDHFKFFEDTEQYSDDTFTVLNGCEMNFDSVSPNKSHHIVCVEPESEFPLDRSITQNQATKLISDSGGLAILAHPYWSLLSFQDVLNMKDIMGIEIWNHVSHAYSMRGGSGTYVDICAAAGLRPLLFAVDDTHFYDTDIFGGYIVVDSPSNSKKDLINAIRAGRFYCSAGPEIHNINRTEEYITVQTSPVTQIAFLSDALWAADRIKSCKGQLITEASYKIKPHETFVRVECVDEDSKTAWSQIIDLR